MWELQFANLFLSLRDTESPAKTAKELGITSSAVYQRLANFEKFNNKTVFMEDRKRNKLVLNEEGRRLVRMFEAVGVIYKMWNDDKKDRAHHKEIDKTIG